MSVHYKFKSSSKKWDTITFDSAVISVIDLKRAIIAQLRTSTSAQPAQPEFDLVVTNAQTGERYQPDNFLIPKNTSVEIRRIPASHGTLLRIRQPPEVTILSGSLTSDGTPLAGVPGQDSTSAVESVSEEQRRLLDVINGQAQGPLHAPTRSTGFLKDFAAAYQAGRATTPMATLPVPLPMGGGARGGATRGGMRGGRQVPAQGRTQPPKVSYICYRCHVPGHYIQDCPTNGLSEYNVSRPKPATGIPSSMLRTTQAGQRGQIVQADGTLADIEPNERAFQSAFAMATTVSGPSSAPLPSAISAPENNMQIPSALSCGICHLLYTRPTVTASCCYTTYCLECIRQTLIESGGQCPFCHQPIDHPDQDLKPNPAIERAVKEFQSSHPIPSTVPIQVYDRSESPNNDRPVPPSPIKAKSDVVSRRSPITTAEPSNNPIPIFESESSRSSRSGPSHRQSGPSRPSLASRPMTRYSDTRPRYSEPPSRYGDLPSDYRYARSSRDGPLSRYAMSRRPRSRSPRRRR